MEIVLGDLKWSKSYIEVTPFVTKHLKNAVFSIKTAILTTIFLYEHITAHEWD
jgi:hypothetical protein